MRAALSLTGVLTLSSPLDAFPAAAQSVDAKRVLKETARAMGGVQAMRDLKSQVIVSEGSNSSPSKPFAPGDKRGTPPPNRLDARRYWMS